MQSMTGFGKAEAADYKTGISFSVEIASVNRKQLDIRPNLPREFSGLEPLLRRLIGEKVSRGSVMARVYFTLAEAAATEAVSINHALLQKLADQCRALHNEAGGGSWSISELLGLPGVIEPVSPDVESEEVKAAFSQAVTGALNALVQMRAAEGRSMAEDICLRLDRLTEIVNEIEPLTVDIPESLKQKLLEKMRDADLPVDPDDERVIKEVVIYSDRSDVSEEITRLRSHFKQFRGFLEIHDKPVGRSMDFLVQEIFREINTLGNKANGCEVTPMVVQFKTELEKIREQVQNIE
ncbi:YicC family protein [Lentisphaerota bacterium ZTH]|nr:YicC family protein [Lentisphaerota bacterium]WET07417.1 YicC family protein [Lentisphaerota bacterium ZTH]